MLNKKETTMRSHKVYDDDLKDVIKRNVDAMKGYEKAADKVKNSELKNAFQKEAAQRRQFAMDLQNNTHVLEDDAVSKIEDGSFKGNLHRTWMDVKAAFSTDKEEEIVEECIRGERSALEDYDDLLQEKEIVSPERDLIREQRNRVEECIHELERLENVLD
jgi:uncharacterized protein (TIGR02284 family)